MRTCVVFVHDQPVLIDAFLESEWQRGFPMTLVTASRHYFCHSSKGRSVVTLRSSNRIRIAQTDWESSHEQCWRYGSPAGAVARSFRA